ncbi:hypothetical protein [Mycolicibacterium mengxianglii]|uniref:hypothetical protein n=1 Tax=Mycolicibacterium mengxianglii TaxID=2736649 RepID=UPI001E450098|nr:hypothetical protein [Mycolicibacterium mengxianglii]
MTASLRRLSCAIAAFALTAGLAVSETPSALAAPGDSPSNSSSGTKPRTSPTGATPAITWAQLGMTNQVELIGANQSSDVRMPVPDGVTPLRLTGTISTAIDTAGRVDVFDAQDMQIASIPIPQDLSTAPFSVNISKARITDDASTLKFVIRDYDNDRTDSCVHPPEVTLSQIATTYSGTVSDPTTVADFLPGYLDAITIRVGPDPSPEQQQAAVALVAKLTHMYRPLPLRIDVNTSTGRPPTETGTARRVIDIRDGGKAGIAVEHGGTAGAVLAITGEGPALLRQVELFADRRVALAQTDSVSVMSASEKLTSANDTMTFSQLGLSGQASVLNTAMLYSGFDAGAFGVGQIQSAKVHLLADYTPVVDSEASMLVRAGDTVLASTRLDDTGKVDLDLDIPAEAISSNVGLAFELRYFPKRQCAPLTDRMTFVLDPNSTVTVTPGTNNRGGFPALPMAFTPDFNVSVQDPAQIRYAAQAIHLMAQQSTVALRPNVVPLDEAARDSVGLIVVAPSDELTRLGMNPPIDPADPLRVDGSTITEVDVKSTLGVVQAFSRGDKMILAISGDDALLEHNFDFVYGLQSRWASLDGDVVATGVEGATVNLTIRAGGYLENQVVTSDHWRMWMWFTLAVSGIAAAAVAGALVVRQRRTKRPAA